MCSEIFDELPRPKKRTIKFQALVLVNPFSKVGLRTKLARVNITFPISHITLAEYFFSIKTLNHAIAWQGFFLYLIIPGKNLWFYFFLFDHDPPERIKNI